MDKTVETPVIDHSREQKIVKWLGVISPFFAVVLVPVIHRYMMTILYLQLPAEGWDLSVAYRSKIALAAAVMLPAFIGMWWLGLKLQPFLDRRRVPLAALLSLIAIPICSLPFSSTRLTWFFVEWAIPRTPMPSFARNTLFWERRNFESIGKTGRSLTVGLVGSSQTNQGFDLQMLHDSLPNHEFEKNCLAGFGPMQYPFLLERLCERKFDVVVCQLSEFDFYREDVVPVSRLRWAAGSSGFNRLWSALTPVERFRNRGDLADIWFAARVPLWRNRDHFRRVAMDYWWKKSVPQSMVGNAEVVLAESADLKTAIDFLRKNVGRKELVEANFRSFERFARELRDREIQLIVIEGQVHPDARHAYDTDGLQKLTRTRLTSMAAAEDFRFLDQSQLPALTASDFADAYHLNDSGRSKLTHFLISRLRTDN